METQRHFIKISPKLFDVLLPELVRIQAITLEDREMIQRVLACHGPNIAANILIVTVAGNEDRDVVIQSE